MKPGIYYDLGNEEYHSGPGISKSGLDSILKSPAHYKSRYLSGRQDEPTQAMLLGSAAHTFILEPDKFNDEVAIVPNDLNMRTKAGQEWKKENSDKIILKPDDLEKIKGMAESISRHESANNALSAKGNAEVSIFAELYGPLFKCRPDYLRDDGIIVDLKTTIDASPESFARSCVNFGYHRQEALYRMIYKLHFGEEPRGFIFVAVEKEPPYAVGVYVLGEEELNLGYNQINNAIDIYLECIRFDTWPSYSEKIITLDYPKWAFK